MEEEGIGAKLSKRLSGKGGGEVDYKSKSGTAWSHSYLNQKPWHPLSYPNQRRKWIAEQTHANSQRRADEVSREYAQEQDFFRQTALISKKEKEKVEMMQAVSFMYMRPPGFNAESAKAAEIADERRHLEQGNSAAEDSALEGPSTATMRPESMQGPDPSASEKKKTRPRDAFGRALPTEEDFEVLKNAPRLETGVAGRAKPFAVELRNVKCIRCGNHGHQSGDRECPLKDVIMPMEENRLKRDDPLTAILAHTESNEPLKWELKQKPGLSPPRGGFKPDDPNQQIVAEDIYDEYGGFLGGENILELLPNFSSINPRKKKCNRKSKQKRRSSQSSNNKLRAQKGGSCSSGDDMPRRLEKHQTKKKRKFSESSSSEDSEQIRHYERSLQKHCHSLDSSDFDRNCEKKRRPKRKGGSCSSGDDMLRRLEKCKTKKKRKFSESSSSEDSEQIRHHERSLQKHCCSLESSGFDRNCEKKRRPKHCCSSENRDSDGNGKRKKIRDPSSSDRLSKNSWLQKQSYSSEKSDSDGHLRGNHRGSKSNERNLQSRKELCYSRSNEKSNYKSHVRGNNDHGPTADDRRHKKPPERLSYSSLLENSDSHEHHTSKTPWW